MAVPQLVDSQYRNLLTVSTKRAYYSTEEIGVEFHFALPHHPWQRGTNENTNGLLREYFPKGESSGRVSEKRVQEVCDKLNRRPRKRLGYRTPYEVHSSKTLHLI